MRGIGWHLGINRALAKQAGTLRTWGSLPVWAPAGHVHISERRLQRARHIRFIQQTEGRTPSRREVRQ